MFIFAFSLLAMFSAPSKAAVCPTHQISTQIVPCVGIEWASAGAQLNQNSPFLITLLNEDGSPSQVDKLEVDVKLWMDMGQGHAHGSKPTTITYFTKSSVAFVDQVWFVMKGEWQLKVTLRIPESDISPTQEEEIVFKEIIHN